MNGKSNVIDFSLYKAQRLIRERFGAIPPYRQPSPQLLATLRFIEESCEELCRFER